MHLEQRSINTTVICGPIDGKPDFYGEGIRIGIYLQWISAWLTMALGPGQVQDVYGINSIFLFAVIIATISASLSDNVDLLSVEIFIMLQIAFGFFVTTLSIFGLRVQLFGPKRLQKLGKDISKFRSAWKKSQVVTPTARQAPNPDNLAEAGGNVMRSPGISIYRTSTRVGTGKASETQPAARDNAAQPVAGTRPATATQQQQPGGDSHQPKRAKRIDISFFNPVGDWFEKSLYPVTIPIGALAFLKFDRLSWSGVLWRSGISATLAGFNLNFWWIGIPIPSSGSSDCSSRIFMFANAPIDDGHLVWFFRSMSIIIVVLAIPPAAFLVLTLVRLLFFIVMCVSRELFYRAARSASPDADKRIRHRLEKINELFQRVPELKIGNFVVEGISIGITSSFRSGYSVPVLGGIGGLGGLNGIFIEFLQFFSAADAKDFHWSDIWRIYATLASEKTTIEKKHKEKIKHDKTT